MDAAVYTAALNTLASTPDALRALLASFPDALAAQSGVSAWSARDVLAHLCVSQRIGALVRIRAIVEHDMPALAAHDEGVELQRSGLQALPAAELLDLFAGQRAIELAWLRTIDPAALARSGRHSEVGRVTGEELLCHAAHHDCVHVGQIAAIIGSRFEPLRGGMRAF